MDRLEGLNKLFITQQIKIYDYIIVGAGAAGLHAAQLLTQNGIKNILILEAQPFVGGRIHTYKLSDIPALNNTSWFKNNPDVKNIRIQKGATWIESQHHYLKKLAKDFKINLVKQFDVGDSVYVTKDKVYTSSELMNHKKYGIIIHQLVNKIEKLARDYDRIILSATKVTDQYKQILAKYDSMTIDSYLRSQIKQEFIRQLFDNFIQHTQCADCRQNSMHELLIKNARSFDLEILKTFLGAFEPASSYLIQGGTTRLLDKIIESIEKNIQGKIGKILKLGSPVAKIDNCSPNWVDIYMNNNVFYRAKQVILAVPIAVSKNIQFTKLSNSKKLIMENQADNIVSKTFVFAKKPFWNNTANGDSLFDESVNISMGHDISPEDESIGIMVFFHSGNKYRKWIQQWKGVNGELKRKYLIKLMAKMFMRGDESNKDLQELVYFQSTYSDDSYIRAGFQSNTKPGIFTKILNMGECLQSYYKDENNVIFVGSEYSKECASYIEGAIRVVRQKLLSKLGVKDQIRAEVNPKKSI